MNTTIDLIRRRSSVCLDCHKSLQYQKKNHAKNSGPYFDDCQLSDMSMFIWQLQFIFLANAIHSYASKILTKIFAGRTKTMTKIMKQSE